jgi:hypothetical protein
MKVKESISAPEPTKRNLEGDVWKFKRHMDIDALPPGECEPATCNDPSHYFYEVVSEACAPVAATPSQASTPEHCQHEFEKTDGKYPKRTCRCGFVGVFCPRCSEEGSVYHAPPICLGSGVAPEGDTAPVKVDAASIRNEALEEAAKAVCKGCARGWGYAEPWPTEKPLSWHVQAASTGAGMTKCDAASIRRLMEPK